MIPFSAEFELKVAEKESEEEKKKLIESLGAKRSMIDKIIQTG